MGPLRMASPSKPIQTSETCGLPSALIVGRWGSGPDSIRSRSSGGMVVTLVERTDGVLAVAELVQPLVVDAEVVGDLVDDGDVHLVDHVIHRFADPQDGVHEDRGAVGGDDGVSRTWCGSRVSAVW